MPIRLYTISFPKSINNRPTNLKCLYYILILPSSISTLSTRHPPPSPLLHTFFALSSGWLRVHPNKKRSRGEQVPNNTRRSFGKSWPIFKTSEVCNVQLFAPFHFNTTLYNRSTWPMHYIVHWVHIIVHLGKR
jgi:hypothetical protein